ncbi:MAG: His/Gly/Thr/Pro-type tRNA ligase C-terminal domain-containing protein, partial [Anaerolineae bacterium]
GVGFGSGIERIVLGLKEQYIAAPEPAVPPVLVAHFGGKTKDVAVQLTYRLRDAGIGTRLAFARTRRSLKSQMREANKHDVRFVLIVGESEVAAQAVAVRPLDGGDQIQIPQSELIGWLKEALDG